MALLKINQIKNCLADITKYPMLWFPVIDQGTFCTLGLQFDLCGSFVYM